ncbi:hypothetical protein DBR47_00725 [Paucibacter sp. KBW04]|nr:hypothetical protein DBR47_00725 [Paucibacter sp. KBW04]
MRESDLEQQTLADLMGVKLDRVKSLVLGRVKHLRGDELFALREKLQLRQEWLVNGQLPMRGEEPPPDNRFANLQEIVARRREAAGVECPTVEAMRVHGQEGGEQDLFLLQESVKATSEELRARNITMPAETRLRLYWAVFELSLQVGQVNRAAIGPLLKLATPSSSGN